MFHTHRRQSVFGTQHDFSWHRSLTTRKSDRVHHGEDTRLLANAQNTEQLIDRFLFPSGGPSALEPVYYSYEALRVFLRQAKYDDLARVTIGGRRRRELAFIDDRKDSDAVEHATRPWQSDAYRATSRPGIHSVSRTLDEHGLHVRLREQVSCPIWCNDWRLTTSAPGQPCAEAHSVRPGLHRRANADINRYVADLTSLCALAIIDTVATRFASHFRDFLQRYLSRRALFQVIMVRGPRNVPIVLTKAQPTFGFVLEFHIPFLAVREQSDLHDARLLRKSYDLPEWLDTGRPTAKFHESQLSLLVYGPDEWLWTTFCFVDTFYGSEVTS